MPATTPTDSSRAADTSPVTPNFLQERLAEAASYAVLRRIAPALRHDVAGFMQPVGMLVMVLQRRVHMPDPDMQAISTTVASVSALTKEATTGCINALDWMASHGDTRVGLRGCVDEAAKLLAMELSASGLKIANHLPDDGAEISQRFFRSVLMGALLAFSDQQTVGGTLQVNLDAESGNNSLTSRLMLRLLPGSAGSPPESPDVAPKSRNIEWLDVEAMADSFGVHTARGDGWISLELPPLAVPGFR
jgi:hypothetical protein